MLQLNRNPKDLQNIEHLKDCLTKLNMYGGKQAYSNKINFNPDQTFTEKSGTSGKWQIIENEDSCILEMSWDDKTAQFYVSDFNPNKNILNLKHAQFLTKDNSFDKYEIKSVPINHTVVKMLLDSHPG